MNTPTTDKDLVPKEEPVPETNNCDGCEEDIPLRDVIYTGDKALIKVNQERDRYKEALQKISRYGPNYPPNVTVSEIRKIAKTALKTV